ncbi:MAG TPA: N-acetyl sugar amidotransferase [Desulfatiglandales bacterium]|nr:N-acetyl sugar amidotransferase [Desulfatiglandales bacterium]
MTQTYQICTKCIMDTTDPDIWFDDDGGCSHCHHYESIIQGESYLKKREDGALDRLLAEIKGKGANKKHDCIIGVSGGVDSTYVAYTVKKLGLQPLAVHLDNGWNSEMAVSNMKKTLEKLDIDLYNYEADYAEFYDLQLAFLKASTPDSEIPTDHALLAALYEVAARENIQFILSGHNTATEGGGVAAWSQGHADWGYVKAVHKQFGKKSLRTFPHCGIRQFIYYSIIKRIKWIPILDYLDYDKKDTMTILENELDWKYYGGKHYESIYTRFCQGYILPKKFGFDKRRLHLSSLIWSGQMSRDDALEEMTKPDYPLELQEQDRRLVEEKLGISHEEFEKIMCEPPKSFWDYPSYKKIFKNKQILSVYHALKRR